MEITGKTRVALVYTKAIDRLTRGEVTKMTLGLQAYSFRPYFHGWSLTKSVIPSQSNPRRRFAWKIGNDIHIVVSRLITKHYVIIRSCGR